ncbi:MAG TPA: cupin domain-containing protein [Polyangia bacterium]|nr:cupin domain-containing protein [Polyangia bacterium]
MRTSIAGFRQDPAGDWIADLACGHRQHVRHRPPWQLRPWIDDPAARAARVGAPIDCPLCEAARPMTRAQELIATLGLQPHPERGYFVETYRAKLTVDGIPHGGPRAASTAIYFLIEREAPTTYLHRLLSDEIFHFYEGGPLDVLMLAPDGSSQLRRLGTDLAAGERPQIVIPAGTWFAAELAGAATHCLFGCTVAPGFDFADFELAAGPELAARYPAHAARIARMTRPSSG